MIRVLLVDDDEAVRDYLATVLGEAGYEVTAVSGASEALALDDAVAVDLLVSDVVMPGCGGVELARRLRERRPALKVLLATGYTKHIVGVGAGIELIEKPFARDAFLHRVRKLIGEYAT